MTAGGVGSTGSADGADTGTRILEAALRTLGRHGPHKLNMRDVGVMAGLARATVYRYFPTKDDLLRALVRYERQRFYEGVHAALVDASPADHARNLVAYLFDYLREHPALEHFVESEPGFVLSYLRDHEVAFKQMSEEALREALATSSVVESGALTVAELVDVLMRLLLSTVLLPPKDRRAVQGALQAVTEVLVAPAVSASPRRA